MGWAPTCAGGRRHGEDEVGGRAALARSLRQALEEGGVTFVKLGQLMSTRRDLLPEEFISELSRLQDRAEPAPWEQVEEVITRSLGAPAEEVFAELQPEPAAAASIAQVHKARLRCGDDPDAEVAVKVQRPGSGPPSNRTWTSCCAWRTRSRTARAGRVRWHRPRGPRVRRRHTGRTRLPGGGPEHGGVAATWQDQQRAVSGSISVVLPAVHEQLCTEYVLVIEWLDGVNLREAGPLIDDRGLDRAELTRALLRSMVYQITEAACSTPTRIRATSCCSPTAASPCSISARSPARFPAAVRAAEPAARGRARRPRGAPRRPAGAGHPHRGDRRMAAGAGPRPFRGASPGGHQRADHGDVHRPVPAGLAV